MFKYRNPAKEIQTFSECKQEMNKGICARHSGLFVAQGHSHLMSEKIIISELIQWQL